MSEVYTIHNKTNREVFFEELQEKYNRHIKKPLSRLAYIVIYAAMGYFLVHQWVKWTAVQASIENEKMKTACPTLLSIARTSRDTLLVMRSEQLCIKYVLTTLK